MSINPSRFSDIITHSTAEDRFTRITPHSLHWQNFAVLQYPCYNISYVHEDLNRSWQKILSNSVIPWYVVPRFTLWIAYVCVQIAAVVPDEEALPWCIPDPADSPTSHLVCHHCHHHYLLLLCHHWNGSLLTVRYEELLCVSLIFVCSIQSVVESVSFTYNVSGRSYLAAYFCDLSQLLW